MKKNQKQQKSQIKKSKQCKNFQDKDHAAPSDDDEIKTKLRRGFKKCKNPQCSFLLHIHTKICVECGHQNQFLPSGASNKLSKKNKDNVLEFARKLIELQTSVKVPKKHLDSIYVLKKNFLQKDQSNLDKNLLAPLLYDMSTRLHADQSKSRQHIKECERITKTPNKMWKMCIQQQNKEFLEIQSQNQQVINYPENDWRYSAFNFGCPIMSIQYAPRLTSPDPQNLKQDFSQYLAVSLQINHYDYKDQDDELFAKQQYQTIADYDLRQFHISGVSYKGQGLVAMIKISYDNGLNIFSPPKLMYHLVTQEGCILKMKWCPKYSSSNVEIGLLGLVTALGLIQIVSVPNQEKKSTYLKTGVIQTIRMSNVLITTFDWAVSKENDMLAVGDQNGSVYILKLGLDLNAQGFIVLNVLPNLHIAEITDLQFYLHNDSICPLLASASFDGNVKILEPLQSSDPILDLNLSSKGIVKISWDYGGKYLQVIRDDLINRVLLLSFFAVEKGPKGQEAGYDLSNIVEQRFFGKLSGSDTVVNFSTSFNQNKTYFSNYQGKIYSCASETIRKLAVKKEKKQTQNANLFSHIMVDNVDETVVAVYQTVNSVEQDPPKRKKLDSPHGFNSFNELHVCPNNLKEITLKNHHSLLQGFLAQSCLQGVLIISTIMNES